VSLDVLYNKKFVAERYHISTNTLNRWVSEGKIPYVKIGKSVRFKESLLKKWEKKGIHQAKPTK